MARLVGVDLPREKRVEVALTYIFGVGRTRSKEALAATGVNPNTRVKTRRTLASRMGTRSEKQKAAIAPAVDRPMPGKVASISAVRGNSPPWCVTTCWAQRCRLRARV